MSDLKPCPFCSGKARPFELTWHAGTFGSHMFEKPFWRVICGECKAAIGDFDSKAEAIAAWNSRAERTCKFDYEQAAEYWQRMYEQTFAERTCRDTGENEWHFVCSACGYEQNGYECWNYCPSCGCKVVGE